MLLRTCVTRFSPHVIDINRLSTFPIFSYISVLYLGRILSEVNKRHCPTQLDICVPSGIALALYQGTLHSCSATLLDSCGPLPHFDSFGKTPAQLSLDRTVTMFRALNVPHSEHIMLPIPIEALPGRHGSRNVKRHASRVLFSPALSMRAQARPVWFI